MHDTPTFYELRQQMVDEQIQGRGIRNAPLLEVMRKVPRHLFVASEYWEGAYADMPLPTGYGQTISQPYIVALMTSLLHLKGEETVLEVGTGSGYQAAILAHLARQVHTVEVYPNLAERARQALDELGITNVQVHVGDGSTGLTEWGPYEAILVTAAAPETPMPLLEQLAVGGRLVLPVGNRQGQNLQLWQRMQVGWEMDEIAPVAFVPLRGKYGWKEEDW